MASDSLIIAGQIELIGAPGGVQNTNPLCVNAAGVGAIFRLQPGYDLGAAQPTNDFIGSLSLDGERPYGRRASDRTITLPLQIVAPDFTTQAGALELLSQVIDQQTWTLTWTRDPSQSLAGGLGVGLPLVLDCFRAQASALMYGGIDQTLGLPIGAITITFQALPYGHSDQPVSIAVASPIPGQSAPPAPVVLDTFSSVSGTDFSSDTQFIVGPHSAKWTHGGSTFAPLYTKTGLSANLTGLTALSVYLGFGAAFPATFVNPVTVTFTLTDGTHTLSFSVSRTFAPSGNAGTPHFSLVTAAIPQGRTFTYSNVTGYTILVSSVPASPAGVFGFGFNTWLDHVVANPPSLQVASARGAVYDLLAVTGTARAPMALQVQQPGQTVVKTFSVPGPFQYKVPANLAVTTIDATATGGGGAGQSLLSAGQGAGGPGGETSREATLAVTAGETLSGVVGAGGTPLSNISTLAVTTTALPTATVATPYTATLTASGGAPPYTWAHTTGVVPTGLSLNTSTGVISGTASGSAVSPSLGFTVTDSASATATTVLVLRVVVAATFAITTTSLPSGSTGAFYNQALATNGAGTPPVTWSVSVPPLPPGLTLDTVAGVISGTPTTGGTYPFTIMAADSAAHTDAQAFTLVINTVTTSSAPLMGWNSGNNYKNGSPGGGSNWQTIYNTLVNTTALKGQAVGYRSYRPGIGAFPTTWNSGHNIPADATFSVLSWKVNIGHVAGDSNPLGPVSPSVLNGDYDAAITAWATSCQQQWNRDPGSLYVSFWHEGDSLNPGGSNGNPTSAQVLHLHAYIFPRFVKACKAVGTKNGRVPYGQMTIGLTVKNNPSNWVSCKATVTGGSDLDWYGIDGYSVSPGNPSPATMYQTSWNNILALAPNARVASTENNAYTQGAQVSWFNTLFALCQTYNALFFLPFWNGCDNGDPICFSTTDTQMKGINGALRTILGKCAVAGSVTLPLDPPAVNGQDTWLQGDSVLLYAHGGASATSNILRAGATGSANTVHFDGGASAAGSTGGGSSPGTPYTVASYAGTGTASHPIPVTGSTTTGDAIQVITGSNNGVVTGVSDSQGNVYGQSAPTETQGGLSVQQFTAVAGPGGSQPTVRLASGTDTVTAAYATAAASQTVLVRGCAGVATVAETDFSGGGTGTGTAMTTGSSGTLSQASEWAVAGFVSGQPGGTPSGLPAGGFALVSTIRAGSAGGPVLRTGTAGVTTGGLGTSLAFTVPSGSVTGDWICIQLGCYNNAIAFNTPAGFTAIPIVSGGTAFSWQMFYRVMDGTEGWTPGTSTVTVVFTTPANVPASGTIFAVGNTSGPDPLPSVSGSVNTASTTITVPGVTAGSPADLAVWTGFTSGTAAGGTAPGTITVPAGFTAAAAQANSTAGGTNTNIGVRPASLALTVAGATGNKNGTDSASFRNGGLLLTFAPHHYLTVADQKVAATTALTATATVVSTAWAASLETLEFAAAGAGFGGGGGAGATSAGAGAAAAGTLGGGTAGDGSGVPDVAPQNGMSPGDGGGGAASSGPALQGGTGSNGQIVISRQTTVEAFSTLIVHAPGPDAPANFSPLVSFGSTPVVADNSVEYPVPPRVTGVNAVFGSTYTVMMVAAQWDHPGNPRQVTVTINQYEFPGGPSHTAAVQRTLTPADDDPSGNGIVDIGVITLPVNDVDPGNTTSYFTIQIQDTNLSDLWLDVLFLDTLGQTVIVSDPVNNAYQTYYLDAPASNRDLGRILGTNTDRTAAVSVMSSVQALSGGALALYPGDNTFLAYCVEGAPQLGILYYPAWYIERTS